MTVDARDGGRLVFLDVDGTYASHGRVPAGHVAVVRGARAAGNRVFLCTGRSKAMLTEGLLEAGFDGIVASAGAYVELEGQVLADRRFPPALATRTLAVLDEYNSGYLLEAPSVLYGRPGTDARFEEMLVSAGDHDPGDAPQIARMAEDILARLEIRGDLRGASFAKIALIDSDLSSDELARRIGPEVAALPSSLADDTEHGGELYLAAIDKALGIRDVCHYLGMGPESVIAFGDSLNDLEMLEFAGIGVVIVGADPRLVAVANRAARGPEDEGLVDAFVTLGLV